MRPISPLSEIGITYLVRTHYYLGSAYAKQERIDEAISEFWIVVALNPGDTVTRKNIGILAAKQLMARTPKKEWMAPGQKKECGKWCGPIAFIDTTREKGCATNLSVTAKRTPSAPRNPPTGCS